MRALPAREWSRLHRRLLAEVQRRALAASDARVYATRGASIVVAYGLAWAGLACAPGWPQRLVLLLGATFAVMQSGFMSHDISHHNVSRNRGVTRALGQLFMSFLGGQAWAHWQWQHLSHHRHTQEAHSDPDLDVDWFALSPAAAAKKKGLARWVTQRQGWLLWPAIALQAFAVRANSVRFLLQRRGTWLDAVCYAGHFAVWLLIPAYWLGVREAGLNYVLLTLFTGPCLSMSFIWNHIGTDSFETTPGGPYMAQRVYGSRNLVDNAAYRLFFGGLNFHVEHHLAPHVPSSRLSEVRPLLEALLREVGVELPAVTFTRAMRDVVRYVNGVGASLRAPAASAAPVHRET